MTELGSSPFVPETWPVWLLPILLIPVKGGNQDFPSPWDLSRQLSPSVLLRNAILGWKLEWGFRKGNLRVPAEEQERCQDLIAGELQGCAVTLQLGSTICQSPRLLYVRAVTPT